MGGDEKEGLGWVEKRRGDTLRDLEGQEGVSKDKLRPAYEEVIRRFASNPEESKGGGGRAPLPCVGKVTDEVLVNDERLCLLSVLAEGGDESDGVSFGGGLFHLDFEERGVVCPHIGLLENQGDGHFGSCGGVSCCEREWVRM